MKRAVFLDRDGTLNAMVYNAEFGLVDSPANPDELRLLPGVAEAVARFSQLGFTTVMISNQPGIAKGKFSTQLLEAMNQKLVEHLAAGGARLDGMYVCPHHPEGVVQAFKQTCSCRKPKPGMLLQAAAEMEIDLANSYFIGDGITDMQAGQAAGTKTILLYNSSKCYICGELSNKGVNPDHIVADLPKAAEVISRLVQRQLTHGG